MNDPHVRTAQELGARVRARRRELGTTQVELAALSDVGPRFVVELERGKPTLELAKVLRVLDRLGLQLLVRKRGDSP
ncbi:MAG: helix-turn-helix transcriptional regulator [Deltaproteobacteria bacterium]|nr:helix-turn-helix transcriptional regulator [Nannocystaceae bacterium]